MPRTVDFLVVGAGVLGLSLARELKQRHPDSQIIVFEKEPHLGKHASGRNSGVLHSGIYYPEGSLKARVCVEGARAMAAYCDEHQLPISRLGKVIVPTRPEDDAQLDLLYRRALANGARAELIDEARLRELEPEAKSASGRALHAPETAVVDPGAILERLAEDLRAQGVEIILGTAMGEVDDRARTARAGGETYAYGHLYNAAGLHADRVAQGCGVGAQYTMMPFKGLYYKLDPASGLDIHRLIYPVPDLNVPFLGVHFTKKVDGAVYLGPTAIPAFGRENYQGLEGLDLSESAAMLSRVARHYMDNKQGFRAYAHAESLRFFKPRFAEAARALAPRLEAKHLLPSDKVGIRAQLVDTEKNELVMDFLVERGQHSTHVLNAVSPAFTSAFSFARYMLDQVGVN